MEGLKSVFSEVIIKGWVGVRVGLVSLGGLGPVSKISFKGGI